MKLAIYSSKFSYRKKLTRNKIVGFGAMLAPFFLVSCGGASINTNNADTLRKSLGKITKNMSEQERKDFGRDAFLIYSNVDNEGDVTKLSYNNLYSNDYELFVPQEQYAEFQQEIYREIALKSSDALNKKSPADLRKNATKIRKKFFATYGEELEQKIVKLESADETLEKMKQAHVSRGERLEKKKAALEEKRKNYPLQYEMSGIKTRYKTPTVSLKTTISNPLDKPIQSVDLEIGFVLVDQPDYKYKGSVNGRIKDGSLAPGADGGNINFNFSLYANQFKNAEGASLGRTFEMPTSLEAYTVTAGVNSIVFEGYERYTFMLDRQEERDLKNLSRVVSQCDARKAQLEKYKADMKDFQGIIKELAKKPEEKQLSEPRLGYNAVKC